MGIYMDISTDPAGIVKAWYTGSATDFGSPTSEKEYQMYVLCLIGRLLSCCHGPTLQTAHDRYLHTEIGEDL